MLQDKTFRGCDYFFPQFYFTLLSCVQLFAAPWTAACQASLSFTVSQELAQTHVHLVSEAIQPSHPLSYSTLLGKHNFLILFYFIWLSKAFFSIDSFNTCRHTIQTDCTEVGWD